jgi:G:T-mismatch repair DNA endonuclease (very short patch repair protein)
MDPTSNVQYWKDKLAKNVEKDRHADRLLLQKGWRVVRIWEHTLKQQPGKVRARIVRALSHQTSALSAAP